MVALRGRETKLRSPGTRSKGYIRQSAENGSFTAPAFFAMFTAIATLAVRMGGAAMMSDIDIIEFRAWALRSYEEADA